MLQGSPAFHLVQPFLFKVGLRLGYPVPCQGQLSISSAGGTTTSWQSLSVFKCTTEHFSYIHMEFHLQKLGPVGYSPVTVCAPSSP